MALRDDFNGYWDGNGLLAPSPTSGVGKGSDNGPMYTSEFYVMLQKSGQLTDQDKSDFAQKIGQCIGPEGMLNRVPIGQTDGQEGPDDYYGVLDGCKKLVNTAIPRKFLWATIKNLGSLDNVNPGKWQWDAFLVRQPQLLCAMIAASFPSWLNPLHLLIRLLCHPLFAWTAAVTAVSCWGADPSDTDARRLSWHLWQTVAPVSPLCWLASRIWLWRLKKAYGSDGMKAVAAIYYHPNPSNPYSKNWITD